MQKKDICNDNPKINARDYGGLFYFFLSAEMNRRVFFVFRLGKDPSLKIIFFSISRCLLDYS